MKKYLNEFIGTFFLVLTVVLTYNNPDTSAMAPLAVGVVYMVMVYAGGQQPGGFYNPAITLALVIAEKMERNEAFYIVATQLIAGFLAASIGVFLHFNAQSTEIVLQTNDHPFGGLFGELLGSFALTYVALSVAVPHQEPLNPHYGVQMGAMLALSAFMLGGLSGAAFNPAVALGGAMAGMFAWGDLWFYFLGAILGGAAAATAYALREVR